MSEITFTDRYQALGIPYPDPKTVCLGQCEGTGWVPIHRDDEDDAEGLWHQLWLQAHAKTPWRKRLKMWREKDRYHFVKCPSCKGTRIRHTSHPS